MTAQATEPGLEPDQSALPGVAEMADDQLAKLGEPKGFDEARKSVARYWLDSEDIAEVFTDEYIGLTYGLMLAEIYHTVLAAANPFRALRQKQVEAIFNMARYLVFLPAQTDDDDGALPTKPVPGAAEELEPHARRISKLFQGMSRWRLLDETPDTLGETLADIDAEVMYWAAKANALADLVPVFDGDLDQNVWPAACLTAATAMWSQVYREALDLAPAQDLNALDAQYRANSALLNICASGVSTPFLVWNRFRNVELDSISH